MEEVMSEEKIEKLKGILNTNPDDFETKRELAFAYIDEGLLNEALTLFNELLEKFSEDADLYFNCGILYERIKDNEKAMECYKKAVEISNLYIHNPLLE